MKKTACSRQLSAGGSIAERAVAMSDRGIAIIVSSVKPYVSRFMVVFVVYCLAMLAIWRSGFSYMDDLGRAIDGYDWSFEFNRYSSSVLAHILSVNMSLVDVSPWFQILSIAILSVSSILVAYIVSGWKRPKWPVVIVSMFVGLTPFMAGSLLYKFDSVCIAASILFSLLPVAVWGRLKAGSRRSDILYCAFATACVLFVLTSYQASCGIVVVAAVAAIVAELTRQSNIKWRNVKVLVLKLGMLALSGVVACAIFYFILPSPGGYRDTNIISVADIIPHVIMVVREIYSVCIHAMNTEWVVLFLLAIFGALLSVVLCSSRTRSAKLVDGAILAIFLTTSIPLSYGIYILLDQATPLSEYDWGRYLIGCGVALAFFFAICSEVISRRTKSISLNMIAVAPTVCVLYGFFIFYLALGNGLADQGRFAESRINNFISVADSAGVNANTNVQFYGTIGLSPVMEHVQEQYPVARYIIGIGQHGLSEGYWGELRLKRYGKFNFVSAPVQCAGSIQTTENEFFKIHYNKSENTACVEIL